MQLPVSAPRHSGGRRSNRLKVSRPVSAKVRGVSRSTPRGVITAVALIILHHRSPVRAEPIGVEDNATAPLLDVTNSVLCSEGWSVLSEAVACCTTDSLFADSTTCIDLVTPLDPAVVDVSNVTNCGDGMTKVWTDTECCKTVTDGNESRTSCVINDIDAPPGGLRRLADCTTLIKSSCKAIGVVLYDTRSCSDDDGVDVKCTPWRHTTAKGRNWVSPNYGYFEGWCTWALSPVARKLEVERFDNGVHKVTYSTESSKLWSFVIDFKRRCG